MKSFYIMGDIHGRWQPIRDFYKRNLDKIKNNKDENILILLGDAGFNYFFNKRDEDVKKKLDSYPFIYFIIRGNHEERPSVCAVKNPKEWHTESFLNGLVLVENKYPYIKYAMDYVSFYNINTYKTLVIPGAYSPDKYYRIENKWSWFPKEQLSKEEMGLGKKLLENNNWKCGLVLTHTCPIIYEPTDLYLPSTDQSMVDKTMERYLGEVEYKLNYKLWCFGHFHSTRVYPKYDNKQMIMLFNNKVIDLSEWIDGNFGKFY